MQLGTPSFDTVVKAARWLRKKNLDKEACALEIAASGGVWVNDRFPEVHKKGCDRCKTGTRETLVHRYHDCPANNAIEDKHDIL